MFHNDRYCPVVWFGKRCNGFDTIELYEEMNVIDLKPLLDSDYFRLKNVKKIADEYMTDRCKIKNSIQKEEKQWKKC